MCKNKSNNKNNYTTNNKSIFGGKKEAGRRNCQHLKDSVRKTLRSSQSGGEHSEKDVGDNVTYKPHR